MTARPPYRYGTSTWRRCSSAFVISFALRRLRRLRGCFPSSLCCFQPPARLSLPEAVFLSRFLAPRLVFIFGMPLSSRSVVRLRAQHDVEHASLHARVVLHQRDVLGGLHHLLEHLPAELRVRHLPPLQAHGDLGLVRLRQDPSHGLQLEVEVVLLALGAPLP